MHPVFAQWAIYNVRVATHDAGIRWLFDQWKEYVNGVERESSQGGYSVCITSFRASEVRDMEVHNTFLLLHTTWRQ